ncbi:MAG: hypothetical protein L3J56_06130 [Bacteroidales bacterium]|nr:hypothetical protein [Bacteroidales bacterium]
MGILESIDKTLKQFDNNYKNIAGRIVDLENTVRFLAIKNNQKNNNDDILVIKFDEDDRLNLSFASKILNIPQKEIILLVKKGELNSIAKKKYVFLASDLVNFKNNKAKVRERKEKIITKNRESLYLSNVKDIKLLAAVNQ